MGKQTSNPPVAAGAASFVPVIPESAPFTPEQRAWLNGFLAGLFSRTPVAAPGRENVAEVEAPLLPLTILFGSQTGNAEALAKRAAKAASQRGYAPTVCDMAQYDLGNLTQERQLVMITSTYGDGDPPDNARSLWEFLDSGRAPSLPELRFSVLALGDSNYPKFCECGRNFDHRLESLGAVRVHARVDCDVEYEELFKKWLDAVLAALCQVASAEDRPLIASGKVKEIHTKEGTATPPYTRRKPFAAQLITNRMLNGLGSTKETRHFEIGLAGSGLKYAAGDALGVMPTNCPELVEDIARALGCSGEEVVTGISGGEVSLRSALLRDYEITRIPHGLLTAVAEKSGDDALKKLAAPDANGELTSFLWGREIIDLLLGFPNAKFSPVEFVGLLKKLQPRLYSISSSPKAHSGMVHLTVSVVRYESLGRLRKGVCSTFLADRALTDALVPVFVHSNENFRPPTDNSRPMIMVGPGTGIAPFRAFLEERRAVEAKGKNWLFFGDQHEQTDFLYREELETLLRDETLTRLDTAFSRDQAEKIYVQDRMLEHAPELFAWLEDGAHFYVCGDASRMVKDADIALHQAVEIGGGRTPEQAAEYVCRLKTEQRYQRDVY
jgi:sulfite reductase (NADPH) flavoprotein alpha-component